MKGGKLSTLRDHRLLLARKQHLHPDLDPPGADGMVP